MAVTILRAQKVGTTPRKRLHTRIYAKTRLPKSAWMHLACFAQENIHQTHQPQKARTDGRRPMTRENTASAALTRARRDSAPRMKNATSASLTRAMGCPFAHPARCTENSWRSGALRARAGSSTHVGPRGNRVAIPRKTLTGLLVSKDPRLRSRQLHPHAPTGLAGAKSGSRR